jgi:hypothetical protein
MNDLKVNVICNRTCWFGINLLKIRIWWSRFVLLVKECFIVTLKWPKLYTFRGMQVLYLELLLSINLKTSWNVLYCIIDHECPYYFTVCKGWYKNRKIILWQLCFWTSCIICYSKQNKHNTLETGNVSVLRWNHWLGSFFWCTKLNRCPANCPPEDGGRSSSTTLCFIYGITGWTDSIKPVITMLV